MNKSRLSIVHTLSFFIFVLTHISKVEADSFSIRMCEIELYACSSENNVECRKIRESLKNLKIDCKKIGKISNRLNFCNEDQNSPIDHNNPYISISWDTKKPSIFGYCSNPDASLAMKCAYNRCIKNGGTYCKKPCNPNSGKWLRSCRSVQGKRIITYTAGSDYGRMGCGSRYLNRSETTVDKYIKRELSRCINASKNNAYACRTMKVWK